MAVLTPEPPEDNSGEDEKKEQQLVLNSENMAGSLSLEQQFALQVLKDQVRGLSLEQAQEYVVEIMRQMMVKDNLVKHLLKNA